jgi:anti-sigma factor RsiW
MTSVPSSDSGETRALLVHAYSDGELDPANALAVGRQIAADPLLAAELAHINALRRILRERLARPTPPPGLLSRIERAVGLVHARIRPSWRALAASLLLAVALGSGSTWFVLRQGANDRTTEAAVDAHVRGLMAARPTDIESGERHTVKPWFNGRIPQAPRVVNLTQEGFPLLGARIDVIGAAPVPTLVYGRRRHIISLSAIPDTARGEGAAAPRSLNGYNVVTWHDNGIGYRAISDLAAPELEKFANLFRSAPAGQ